MNHTMTRTAHLADERAQIAADEASAAREAAAAAAAAYDAAALAAHEAFEALTSDEQRLEIEEYLGISRWREKRGNR